MDIETIERYLSDATLGKRIEAIEFLRSSLREEARSTLLNSFSAKVVILRALERCLADRNWEIRHKSIQFVNEILERDQYSADQYMFSIVPPLILSVADPKITVRRVALQTIHCYLRYANDRKLALYSIVKYGLDNEDVAVQRDWCVALPVVLTAEQAELDYSEIIQSLVRKLDAPELSETALKVLQHISNLVGAQRFYDTVKRLPHSVRVAYARYDPNVASMLTPSPAAGVRASALSFTSDVAARRASNTDALLDSTSNFREDPRLVPEQASARKVVGEPPRAPDSDFYTSNAPPASNRYPPAANLGATSNRTPRVETVAASWVAPSARQPNMAAPDVASSRTARGTATQYTGRQNDDAAREQMLKQFVSEHPPDAAAKLNVRRIVAQEELQSDESGDEDEDEDEEIKFGCLPMAIGNMLENESDAKVHLAGGEELKKLVQTLSGDDMRRMEPHLLGFLSYLNSFLDDPNLRFTMLILESLEILVIKLASYMLTTAASRGSVQASIETNLYVRHILAILMKRLSENKNILRQTAFKMITQLMHIFQKPMLIIDQLTALNFFMHRNSRVRQETLNLLIVALLTYPSNMFDLAKMSRLVVGLLVDPKRQVRLAAFECIAVLAQALGSGNRQILLNAVDQVELEQVTVTNASTNQNQQTDADDVSLMSAVQARLARRQLPRLIRPSSSSFGNPSSTTEFDLHIEYALQLPTASQLRQFPFATLSADVKWITAAATGSSSTVPSAQLTPGPAASQRFNGTNVEPHRPIQAWSSPDPSTEKPNGAQKTTVKQPEASATPAQNDGPAPVNGQSRIGSGSLRYSASKLRKLLPWEQEASGTSTVKNEKAAASTPASDTQQKQPFSKFSSVETEAANKPPASNAHQAQQPPQQYAPSNTAKQSEKTTGSVREQLQQLNASAHAESVKKPPAAKPKVQTEAASKPPSQSQTQTQIQKPIPTHPAPPPAAVPSKASKADDTQHLPHPPTAPKNQTQTATPNADFADVFKSTAVPVKRRSLSNEGKTVTQAATEKPESLTVATSTTQLVQQSSTNNTNAAALRVDQSTANRLPQNKAAAPNPPVTVAAPAPAPAATRQSSNDVRESIPSTTSTVVPRKQPVEEKPTPDFLEADSESLSANSVHKSVSTPSFASLAKGSQIPTGISSQQSPVRRVSLFNPEPAPVSNEMALNKTMTTNNSARQNVPQIPASEDTLESDDSDMEQAIQSIRSSAAKKRAERLERLKQAASESHSAPPHSTHSNYFQHQMSLPNTNYVDDGEDDEPLEFDEEDDDGSTLEDTDEERDDDGGSARSRMSQKLVNSMNRKQQEVIQRQVSHVERSRHSEKQEDSTSSQSASSTLRKPPSGPGQKNALNRSQFSSSPNLATGSTIGHSKSAGATASADDEQMMRDVQFISDKSPTELLRMALNGINNQNSEMWEEKCRCLNIVRFLAREHTNFLQSEYRNIRLPILREVRNLRTQVNRVALQLFGDLFEYLGKVTEIDLDSTIEYLLPRAGDTNKFIQQVVQNTLMRLVRFLSPSAAIPTLIQCGSTHRNALVRRTTAQFVAVSVERYVGMQSNRTALHETAQTYGVTASEDADPGCRQHGRRIIAALNGSPQGDSNNNADRKQTSSAPVSKMSNGRTKKNSLGANVSAQSQTNAPDASTILADLQASDVQARLRGIDAYQNYLARGPTGEVGADHSRAFEQFCKCLTDQNAKVSFRALQAFSALYQVIFQQITFDEKSHSRDALPLRTCVDSLLPQLANENEQTFALANNILDDFIGDLLENATELITPICSYYQAAPNDVVRAYLLEKLSYIVPRTYSKRSVVIQSSLIPFVWNALNTLSPAFVRDQQSSARAGGEVERVKVAFAKLLKSLYRQMKDDLVVSLERQKSGKADQLITLLTEQQLSLKEFVGKIAT